MPKRKPSYVQTEPVKDKKPPSKPKKWTAFSINDSRAIETAFQKLADEEDRAEQSGNNETLDASGDIAMTRLDASDGHNRSLETQGHQHQTKVPVNEDFLFDVDVRERELGPAYWLGPIYDVRRGTWFDGSTLMPVEENLAIQLEEGYLKTCPWRFVPPDPSTSSRKEAQPDVSETSANLADLNGSESIRSNKSTRNSATAGKTRSISVSSAKIDAAPPAAPSPQQPVLTHRLFGSYMNQMATYQGPSTAWVLSDDFLSKFSSAMIQRFTGGAGTKYIRGFSEVAKRKAPKDNKRPGSPPHDGSRAQSRGARSQSTSAAAPNEEAGVAPDPITVGHNTPDADSRVATLERKISTIVAAEDANDPERNEEEERQRQEQEIQDDYRDNSGESQDRQVDHLILITHGIGQRLGANFDSFNFIHDVNQFRKTLKSMYGDCADLQALNGEADTMQKNCRVQVLPICWRHLLDFPQQGIKHNRREHDIADIGKEDDEEYPRLQDLTGEPVSQLRNVVSDLALDVLLYQTPAYNAHIARIVVKECNRILKLFKQRNPDFEGKVSLIGHSLGSAIMFDILAEQAENLHPIERAARHHQPQPKDLKLKFEVDSFFCLGSPIGLFQMLKGRKIAGRANPNKVTLDGLPDNLDDPFSESPYSKLPPHAVSDAQRDALVSAPKCRQLYNIFHPTDPIGYRLEPLISPAMSSLKPQILPSTGRKSWYATPTQGITGIPAKVGQSFSGLWSNFSSGLTNSIINRSLGLSAEDAAKMGTSAPSNEQMQMQAQAQAAQAQIETKSKAERERAKSQSLGAGTNIVSGGVIPQQAFQMQKTSSEPGINMASERKLPTMIDQEIETLYAGFQKSQRQAQSDAQTRDLGESPYWNEAEERGRKLRREEAKVRALNANGRVDYSIPE